MIALGAVAVASAVKVSKGGKLDIDDAETLFAEILKILVGAYISSISSRLKNDHVSYVFYQPGVESGDKQHSFDEQAKIQKRKYEEKYPGTEVILLPVSTPEEFKKAWNSMDDNSKKIDATKIILHGSINDDIDDDDYKGAGFLYFYDEDENKEYRIITDETVRKNGDNDIRICELDNKKMDYLYFSSCNSANPDAQNTGDAFADKVEANEIVGWDGGSVCDYSKEMDVKGGEGTYKDDDEYDILPDNSLAPAYTTGQPTWWKYVSRDSEGWPTREREGKIWIKKR